MNAGVYKTLANIFISFMGAGILGLPYAFRHAGLALGAAFMLFLSLLAFYAILLLVDCKKALEHRGVVRAHTCRHRLVQPQICLLRCQRACQLASRSCACSGVRP